MNGINFSEEYKQQIREKEILLNLIKARPMTTTDLRIETEFDDEKVWRYLISLKYYKLVAQQTAAEQKNRLLRQYYAISDSSFEQALTDSMRESYERRVQTRLASEARKRELKEKKAIAGVTVVTCNDYHSRGNRSNVNPWTGYTSF